LLGQNNALIGSGSDGSTYWSLYENNAGGPTSIGTTYVTYNTLADMLTDTNRSSVNFLLGQNNALVGSGSDGSTYWSLYENNAGGPSSIATTYVTYNSLADMLTDSNRASTNFLLGQNNALIGGGAFVPQAVRPIPIGPSGALLLTAMAGFGLLGLKRARAPSSC
ncbi:MAG: hypothetical protein AAF679_08310, partial [Pseudomonadota bacterium]